MTVKSTSVYSPLMTNRAAAKIAECRQFKASVYQVAVWGAIGSGQAAKRAMRDGRDDDAYEWARLAARDAALVLLTASPRLS